MTRRVVLAGVLAVCLTALVVGGVAYVLVARDARTFEDRVLTNLVTHPHTALGRRTTYSQLAEVRDAAGTVLRETDALAHLGPLPVLRRGFANVTINGHHLRVLTHHYRAHSWLSVAVSDAPVLASLARLRRGVVIAIVVGALFASLVLIWITRRALAPVRQTAAVADRIVSTGDLTARVPHSAGVDEIAQLSKSINRMLDHLEDSDAALRRLVADASHELRSPVTTLRGNLELLSGGAPLSEADRADALADTHAEAERLGRLVEELLTLARADTVVPASSVVWADLVEEAIHGTGARLVAPGPSLDAATVVGDPVALRAMVRNLAENADRYGGGAEMTIDGDGRWLELHAVDHGPGIPAAERATVFDRFRRGAAAAGGAGGGADAGVPGSGLGLAIVAATARSHGGSVSVDDTPGGGATFQVRLPRAAG